MHGIPISVKDFIMQKGKLTTYGLANLCDNFCSEDSVIVKQYLLAGAIPVVRGNVP
jgi:Asp-tRNA(Asn)/Glu-tRNA(Gln) amidotransferase A subunit family amidase